MSTPPVPISQSKHDRYIVAHAALGSLAVLIVLPAALLVGRYLRRWRHWNLLHIVLNTFSVALIVVCFALGNAALRHSNQYTGPSADLHHQLGLAAFILFLVQAIGGVGAKFTKKPPANYVVLQKRKNPVRYIHIFLGIATLAVLYAQVYTGFDEWDETSDSMTTTPQGIRIAYWVLLGVFVAAYVIGWVLMEPLGHRWRSRQREWSKKEGRGDTTEVRNSIQSSQGLLHA